MKELVEKQLKDMLETMGHAYVSSTAYEEAAEAAERLSRILMHLKVGQAASDFIQHRSYWSH